MSSDTPEAASPLDRDRRQSLLSRKKLLENGARVVASSLGVGLGSGGASHVAGLLAGVPVVAGGWGLGFGQGVQPAEAFGGPSRPLNRYGGPARFCLKSRSLDQRLLLESVSVLTLSGVAYAKALVCVYGTLSWTTLKQSWGTRLRHVYMTVSSLVRSYCMYRLMVNG